MNKSNNKYQIIKIFKFLFYLLIIFTSILITKRKGEEFHLVCLVVFSLYLFAQLSPGAAG